VEKEITAMRKDWAKKKNTETATTTHNKRKCNNSSNNASLPIGVL